MMIKKCYSLLSLALAWLVPFVALAQTPATPLLQAHAHNDYEHARPLLDALDHGFCSVEADIYLVAGQLLVAHDRDKVSPERTLQALYLDPLMDRVKRNDGRVFRGGPEFTLLIDIKSDAETTYAALREVLKRYDGMLTVFRADATEPKAVTVILTGNRPRSTLAAEMVRYAALDGRLPDLDKTESVHFMPLISDSWSQHFKWRGTGPLPEEQKMKLEGLVKKAHQQGRRIRFWAAPDDTAAWMLFHEAGVDLINTDDLGGLQEFLLAGRSRPIPKR